MPLKFTTSDPQRLIEQEIHVGDVDTAMVLRVFDMGSDVFDPNDGQEPPVVDLSSSSTLTMLFRKPDNTVVSVTAGFTDVTGLDGYVGDGTDGYMQFRTTSGFLNLEGKWKMQGRVVIGAATHSTGIVPFTVEGNVD